MNDVPLRMLLIDEDVGLYDRLRSALAQIEGRRFHLEKEGPLKKSIGTLARQEHEIYFVVPNSSQDEAATILGKASANAWLKPIIFLVEHASPQTRSQFLRAGAAGCLPLNQLNPPLLEYAIDYGLEFARSRRLRHETDAEAQKLALVASRTENIVIITDPQGRVEWTNHAFTRITEYTLDEVRGTTPGSLLQGPDTDEATVAHMRERLSRGEGFKAEIINYSKSGRKYWLQIEVQPFYKDDGELAGFTAIESDISERKRTEEVLLLRDRAMGAAAEGIVISDPTQPGNPLIYVNDGFERLTGYRRDEVLGRNCRFLQGQGTDPVVLEQIRESILERRDCLVELLNYRKDGTPFWNRLSIAPLQDTQGKLTHFVGVQSDITARKLAEERLAAANAEILASNNRMKRELEAAATVQQALLPTLLPRLEGFEFAWLFKPSTELAGDQLNVIQLDDARVALYLLDVSGHGVASALMAVAANLLLSRRPGSPSPISGELTGGPVPTVTSPADAAMLLNHQFPREKNAGQYLTLVYGVLNVKSGEFQYAAAGHPGPVVVRKDAPPIELDEATGLPIGLFPTSYEERSVQLCPGDRIYLYSDGITEAMNATGDEFGIQRLLSRLRELQALPLDQSLSALMESLEQWRGQGGMDDDVSVVALEWGK
jgi:phosphoserine phosphatase RsbU/P